MVVVLEVILVRPFLKVGWGILRGGPFPSLYEVLITLGPLILSISLLLSLISSGLAGYLFIKSPSKSDAITSAFLLSFVVIGMLSLFTTLDVVLLMAQNIAALIVITLMALRFTTDGATKMVKIITMLLISSYSSAFWFGIAPALFALGGPKPAYMVEIFNVGEALTIMNALPLYFLFVGSRRIKYSRGSELIMPSIPTALFVGAYLVNPGLTALFSTWVFGFTLYLPFPLYAIAIWLYADTIIKMLEVKEEVAFGLLFIFLAGRNLQSVYLTLLAIIGIFLLTRYAYFKKKVDVGSDQRRKEKGVVL